MVNRGLAGKYSLPIEKGTAREAPKYFVRNTIYHLLYVTRLSLLTFSLEFCYSHRDWPIVS